MLVLYTFGYYLPTLLALATYRRRRSISVVTGVPDVTEIYSRRESRDWYP